MYSIGSCFADAMSHKLGAHKFDVLANPFGIIYHPISLFKLLRGDLYPAALLLNDGIYAHWDVHSHLSGLDRQGTEAQIASQLAKSEETLKKAQWLIITFGSAWAYRVKETGHLVANCHKMPQDTFSKELLSIQEMVEAYVQTEQYLKKINPELKVILTVSPVRHKKDGLVENNRSKARLLEATHQMVAASDATQYFPAHEIVMDELRDYRFFERDLVHPSEWALDYVWERFSHTYFNEDTLQFCDQWSKLSAALHHKPFHPSSEAHQRFLKKTLKSLKALEGSADIAYEIDLIKAQLI